jgi:pimeloyl-ACP methyl ester carboxylesterase
MPWAELNDVRMYYELLGEGDPLLMIPGLGSTCRLWDPVAPDLAQQFSLILPDNRDVGKSAGKRPPHSLSDFASDLVELLDELQVERAHVVGISLGGVIAQSLAVEHPDRIKRLILISTAHRFGPYLRDISALLGRCLYRMPYALFQRTVELLGTAPKYYDEHIDEVEQKIEMVRNNHAPRSAVVTQLRCLAASEVDEAHYHITAPTLVVCGEYDAMIPNCYGQRMAQEIPGSEFRVLEGCGHNPVTEMPHVTLPLITEFLNRRTEPADRQTGTEAVTAVRKRFRDKWANVSYDNGWNGSSVIKERL